ncbi:uncharacterized protein DUF4154 [Prosthecobacter fusiformis]|uniref:Uncharacterized protein DUF4154 n=1 Tax=Prosthecobacter fusiformis TaxID=48464 RepID=A0A4R7RIQ6_9BACT|nr:YfiR family protein [Prosthecobacter fusiformis]TDU63188.1 uncharacterized protein DUF4154 [Prosthecobacter fusiformis]
MTKLLSSANPTPTALRWWLLALLLVCPLFFCPGGKGAEEGSKEHQIKAAFLYNFTKFVVWPEPRPGSPGDAFVMGVLGRNPFGNELEKVVRGRMVGGRKLLVKYLSSVSEATTVDLLFVAEGEESRLGPSMKSLHSHSVLTVGESSRFEALGGIITFSTLQDKIRFGINRQEGQAAGLKISPQLLKLAIPARSGNP